MDIVQTFINVGFGTAGLLGGWVLKFIAEELKQHKMADERLAAKVQQIEVLVAGHYVHKDELARLQEALFRKLDRIELKLDGKVDKE